MGRAYNKHRIGDYIGTIDDLSEMIALQPENAQCYIRRGITRAEVADYQSAIDAFDKAAAITDHNADLHDLLAHAHMHAPFAKIEDDDAGNARPARQLAQKAPRQFQKALNLDPWHTQSKQGIRLLPNHPQCLAPV